MNTSAYSSCVLKEMPAQQSRLCIRCLQEVQKVQRNVPAAENQACGVLAASPRHDFVAWIFSSSVMMDSRWSMSPMSLKMFMVTRCCARPCCSSTARLSLAFQASMNGIKLPPCGTLT
jgi:hypothetical protein